MYPLNDTQNRIYNACLILIQRKEELGLSGDTQDELSALMLNIHDYYQDYRYDKRE